MEPDDYGKYYWCIKVTEDLCRRKEIYVHADSVEVKDGDLFCHGKHGLNLLVAKGQWTAVFGASVFDGSAVAVQWWEGEVVR